LFTKNAGEKFAVLKRLYEGLQFWQQKLYVEYFLCRS